MAQNSTTDGEDGVYSADSPLSNDGDNLMGSSNGVLALKKGPWTSAEDTILVEYVKKHGEGNWNAVQKHSGLLRCGKSCRLRWANHLRPNLKKGAFTPEEEQLIIELHAKMGNKWARMAAHLPGRTDNEIKNYWNTRVKRRQRAGLPLYPPELSPPENPSYQNEHHSPGTYLGDSGNHEMMQSNCYEIPIPVLHSFNKLPDTSEFTSISSDHVMKDFGNHPFSNFVPKTVGFQKHAQETYELMSYCGGDVNGAPSFHRTQTEIYKNGMLSPFGLSYPHDTNLTEKPLCHAIIDERDEMPSLTFSTSKHFSGLQKLELPSFQYQETELGIWDSGPESSDFLVHADHSRPLPPLLSPPCSDGLLEDLVYEYKSLRKAENGSSHQLNSFPITPGGITDYVDPSSPSGNSIDSIFSGCPRIRASGCSLEQQMPVHHVKSEVFDESWITGGDSNENPTRLDYSRPDAILGSCSLMGQDDFAPGHHRGPVADSTTAILGEDYYYSGNNNNTTSATCVWAPQGSSTSWDRISAVHGMSHFS